MSKRISGSSGGPRSFGGSHGGGPRKLSGGSSAGYGSGFKSSGLGVAGGLAELAYDLLGLPGLLITIFALVVVILLIKFPVVGGITFTAGVILFCLIFALRRKKTEDPDLVDMIGHNEKYNDEIVHSGSFHIFMMSELRDKNLLTKKGQLDDSKIDLAIDSFDEIYRSYVRSHPITEPETAARNRLDQ